MILYTDYVQYYVTQVRNFDTCLSKSEKKKFKYLPKIQIFTYTVLVYFMRMENGWILSEWIDFSAKFKFIDR